MMMWMMEMNMMTIMIVILIRAMVKKMMRIMTIKLSKVYFMMQLMLRLTKEVGG